MNQGSQQLQKLINSVLSGDRCLLEHQADMWLHEIKQNVSSKQAKLLNEIKWRSPEVVDSALDAKIYCGFEAETIWPEVLDGIDVNEFAGHSFYDDDVQITLRELVGQSGIDRMVKEYEDHVHNSEYYEDALRSAVVDTAREIVVDDSVMLDDFIEAIDVDLWSDELEQYAQTESDQLRDRIQQLERIIQDEQQQPEPNSRVLGSYGDRLRTAQRQLREITDMNLSELAAEYIRENPSSDYGEQFEEYVVDLVTEDPPPETLEAAWDAVTEQYTIDDYIRDVHDSLPDFLTYHGLEESPAGGISEVAAQIYDGWIENNSAFTNYDYGPYHSTSGTTLWRIETDSSLDEYDGQGAEIISPVYSTPREMLSEMRSLFEWLDDQEVVTNKATGLHVTMSMAGTLDHAPNRVKMAVMLDDPHLLKQFDRLGNNYTRSQLRSITQMAQSVSQGDFDTLKDLEELLRDGVMTDKMTSMNFKRKINDDGNQLIEFRIGGGKNYHHMHKQIQDAVVRYATTMQLGYDPDAYRREYATKLLRLLSKAQDVDLVDPDTDAPAEHQSGTQTLAQAIKELGITDRSVLSQVIRNLRMLAHHVTNTVDSDFALVLYDVVQAVRRGQTKTKGTPRIARLLRTATKLFGLQIRDVAMLIKLHIRTPAEVRPVLKTFSELYAAPSLLDKLDLPEPVQKIQVPATDTLLVSGKVIGVLKRLATSGDTVTDLELAVGTNFDALINNGFKILPGNLANQLYQAGHQDTERNRMTGLVNQLIARINQQLGSGELAYEARNRPNDQLEISVFSWRAADTLEREWYVLIVPADGTQYVDRNSSSREIVITLLEKLGVEIQVT